MKLLRAAVLFAAMLLGASTARAAVDPIPFLTGSFAIFQAQIGTAPPSFTNWTPVRIGTGGIITGVNIAPDGTRVIRTDSFGGYIWPVGGTQWLQLATGARFPSVTGYPPGQGFEEIQIAPSNTQIIWAIWNGMLYKSTNQGATFAQNSLWTTQPAPFANQNSPTKGFGPYIAIDPANPNVVYFSTPSQGLYRTTDGGATTMVQLTQFSAGLPANQGFSGTTPSIGTDTTSLTVGTGSKTFSHNSSSFGLNVDPTNYVQVWDTANPTIQMFGYVTANSGTSLTLNIISTQGSGTIATWTIGPPTENYHIPATGGGHRIVFDTSGGHNCGTGGISTCNVFVHTYHIGTWKSTDGGTTWNPVTATNAPTSITRWATDPFGVLWVVTDDFLSNVNIAKYDGTTWTNPISAAGCCGQTNWSAVAVDVPNSLTKGSTHVTFLQQGTPVTYTYTADGGATWNILPGTSGSYASNSYTSVSGDVTWLSNWQTAQAQNGYFAGNDIAYDPLNTGRVWVAAEGMWYFVPTTTATTNLYTQQSVGIEEFIAAHIYAPTGGSVFTLNWDYPCFATATFGAYPSLATCNTNTQPSLVIGYSYDWLWSNPAEAAVIAQDSSGANSSSRDMSGSTSTLGGNGTWTQFSSRPCTGGQSGGEIAITAHNQYFAVCVGGSAPLVTTTGGGSWAPISIPGGTPSHGWGINAYYVPFSSTIATDHTNGDVYLYNWNTGSGVDALYKYTASSGLWSTIGSPNFSFAYINEQIKTVYGQTGHLLFTPGVAGTTPSFSSTGGSSWGTIPGFGQVMSLGSGAAFSGNYSSIYAIGYYTGTVNLEGGGTQAVSNQYWTYMCKNFQISTRLCTGNWTQIGPTPNAGDMLVPTVDITGDPSTPGLVYIYGHGGAFWGQYN